MTAAKKTSVKSLRVEDIMTSPVVAVTPMMTIKDVVHLFLEKKISGAPIVDQSGKVISVISQSDLIQFVAVDGMDRHVNNYLTTRLPKTENVISVRRSDLIKEVFRQFLIKPVHRVIVTDDAGNPHGLVSKSDLLKAFVEMEKG